ncbi:hypothetical protein RF679_01130 [Undibacterium cyanobacteriorum]|uniref:DUF1579 domain-containing protein n=1 Tax=Undibacterium cyanobacteriorum TaxID=3073561 RepID=A0ABY9RJ90_9BURK|nr:hypothetical protein [Undibacterium sp. 20NA77.5]WMW80899.1 hypothetical protein RF679_01130 [Undibacterium sp. 20NA77.5]
MTDASNQAVRRLFLQAAAGLAIPTLAQAEKISETVGTMLDTSQLDPGKPGDFDFLHGEWRIKHRRLKDPATNHWDVFDGEATCWSILNGLASIEELRIPARQFSGMGLRILDVENKLWSDFWVNSKSGVLTAPGVTGGFKDKVGIFISEEVEQEKTILARGMWDNISRQTCRWQQAISNDGGKSWQTNWIMDWQRFA